MEQKKVYNHKKIASDYAKRDYLDRAEESILEELHPFLSKMNMLDMGVGAGRTTKYFMPMVNSYIGADYAPNMIKECRKKYKNSRHFEVMDARSMNKFEDGIFDFVLFSFNGIDSFSLDDRAKALNEIKRVLKNNGYFCFSSHNLCWEGLDSIFSFKYIYKKIKLKIIGKGFKAVLLKLISALKAFYINARLDLLNRSLNIRIKIKHLRSKGYGFLADNSLNGKVSIFYTCADFQAEGLKQKGFFDISFYTKEGIKTNDQNDLIDSPWVYYLCRNKK